MKLDEDFASWLSRSATDHNYRILWNDGSSSPQKFADLVEQYFRLKRVINV